MKTVQQLAMWFVDTMDFLNDCGVRESLVVRRQFDRLGESLAAFLWEIAKRTPGATLDDFIRVALIRDIKQEIENTLLRIERMVDDLHNPDLFSEQELVDILKEKSAGEPERREEFIRSLGEDLDLVQIMEVILSCLSDNELEYKFKFLQKIIRAIEAIEDNDEVRKYSLDLISCAEHLMVLAKKIDPEWESRGGMADLSDLLGIKREART